MLRDLLAHKARSAMTLLAIALSVAAVVGSWVAADSVASTIAAADVRDDVGVAVVHVGDATLSPQDRQRLAELDEVEEARGVVVGHAGVVAADGKLADASTVIDRAGGNWDESGRFILVDGAAPQNSGEVALSETVAADAGLSVGDVAEVLLADGEADAPTVTGVYRYQTVGHSGEVSGDVDVEPAVVYDPDTAAQLLDTRYQRVELDLAPGVDPDAAARSAQRVVDDVAAFSGAELAAHAAAEADAAGDELLTQLLPFAGLAVLVSMFVIANTFSMLVTRRTRQLALLRAAGARARQVKRVVVFEAAVLGLAAGTLGVVIGAVAGPGALLLLRPADDVVVSVTPTAIAIGYFVAVSVTVLSAYGSARRAATVSPMAALRVDAAVSPETRRGRVVVGGLLLGCGVAGVVATAQASDATAPRIVAIASAASAAAGILVLTPTATGVVLRPLRRLADRFAGAATRLAVGNASKDSRRTGGTAAAVMIGLIFMCAFATVGSSLEALIGSTTRANLPNSTTVVTPAGGDDARLGPADVQLAASAPGVDDVAAGNDVMAEVDYDGGSTSRIVSAIDPEAMGTVLTPELTAGTDDLTQGVLVAQNQADMLGLELGDEIRLTPDIGEPIEARVVGSYAATELSASIYFDAALASASLREAVNSIYVTGSDPQAAAAGVEAAFADRPDVRVGDVDGVVAELVEEQRFAFLLLSAMFGLAIAVAAVGVVNTLALSVMERTREIGMLRAVGARRSLIRRSIHVESLVICLFGGVAGVLVGVGVGAVMQSAMLGQELTNTTVPVDVVGAALAGTVAVGVTAAWWPARRAAKTDTLRAIAAS